MKYYYDFISLRESGLVNFRPNLPTPYYKQHYQVNNLKIPIKCNPGPPKFDMVKPFCDDTKLHTWEPSDQWVCMDQLQRSGMGVQTN